MKYHVLAIDDDPHILEDVADRLGALGHTCDCVTSMEQARERLAGGGYSYILLDLEIPVVYGRMSRISNGQTLLREIRSLRGFEDIPIVVITSHGHDRPDLAVDALRCGGATDFVRKPFPDSERTLEKAIHDALAATGRLNPAAQSVSSLADEAQPAPFVRGEMVFHADRVELCGLTVCGGPDDGLIRRILDELRKVNKYGRRVNYSGAKLARMLGCERGQNGIAEAVRGFRTYASNLLLKELHVQADRMQDLIQNDRHQGYRLSPKIEVVDGA